VGRIGDEAPQLPLRGLARTERRLDLHQHRVQREPESADLGAFLRALDALREIAGRDRSCGLADRVERAQPEPHQIQADDGDQCEHEHRHDQLDREQAAERRVDVL
jgi:hypothetical protein